MRAAARDIDLVRRFNRFYTKRIGLLREGLLDTHFSLTQARVRFEIGSHPGTRSADLACDLGVDRGFLSRLLKSFERRHLIKRTKSKGDARVSHLSVTSKGRAEFERLDSRSREEVTEILAKLDRSQQQRLAGSMTTIRQLLESHREAVDAIALRLTVPAISAG